MIIGISLAAFLSDKITQLSHSTLGWLQWCRTGCQSFSELPCTFRMMLHASCAIWSLRTLPTLLPGAQLSLMPRYGYSYPFLQRLHLLQVSECLCIQLWRIWLRIRPPCKCSIRIPTASQKSCFSPEIYVSNQTLSLLYARSPALFSQPEFWQSNHHGFVLFFAHVMGYSPSVEAHKEKKQQLVAIPLLATLKGCLNLAM